MSLNNFYSSLIGTGIAEIITLPICTLKTNFQNSNHQSIKELTKKIYLKHGIKAFYNASFPAIAGQMISTSTKYTIYKYLTSNEKNPIKNRFVNGMIGGITSSLMTHPLDVIKVHLQMNYNFTSELKKEGFKLFYRGYSKTFTKIAISSSCFFPIYDTIFDKIHNPLISSTVSGFISAIIMHPVDYLKTRHMSGKPLYQGYNPLVYYKGLTLNLLRIVPHFIITMTIIEYLKEKLI